MKKAKYKIVANSEGFWKYSVYKKVLFFWYNIRNTDHYEVGMNIIRDQLASNATYFDEDGNEIKQP